MSIFFARHSLQRIFEAQGHIVSACAGTVQVGDVIQEVWYYGKPVIGPLLVISLASLEEYQAQAKRWFGISPFPEDHLFEVVGNSVFLRGQCVMFCKLVAE